MARGLASGHSRREAGGRKKLRNKFDLGAQTPRPVRQTKSEKKGQMYLKVKSPRYWRVGAPHARSRAAMGRRKSAEGGRRKEMVWGR